MIVVRDPAQEVFCLSVTRRRFRPDPFRALLPAWRSEALFRLFPAGFRGKPPVIPAALLCVRRAFALTLAVFPALRRPSAALAARPPNRCRHTAAGRLLLLPLFSFPAGPGGHSHAERQQGNATPAALAGAALLFPPPP